MDWMLWITHSYHREMKSYRLRSQFFNVDNNQRQKNFDRTVNFCTGIKDRASFDLFTTLILDAWFRFGNMPRSCPIQPGTYTMMNITLKELDVPSIPFLSGDHETLTILTIWTLSNKKWIKILQTNVYGGYKN